MNLCDDLSEESNAPERPLTAFQHRTIISDKLMDWMESNRMNYEQTSNVLGVSTHVVVSIMDRVRINPVTFLKIADKIPSLREHLKGEENG